MKHLRIILIAMFFTFNIASGSEKMLNSESSAKSKTIISSSARLSKADKKVLVHRLFEISKMDIKSLDQQDKMSLRNEVKNIKDKFQKSEGGTYIYISGTALLIILLLIILL